MAKKWLYSTDNKPIYYQDGDYIFSKHGHPEFSVANGWWHPVSGGVASHYVSDGWVYTSDGQHAFYFG